MVNSISNALDNKFIPYQRMASAIMEIVKEKDVCLQLDLLERGFTHQEIQDQWHMANAMAEIEMKLMRNA